MRYRQTWCSLSFFLMILTSAAHTNNKVMVVQVVQRAWTDAPSDTIRRDVRSNLQDVFFCLTKPTGWSGTQCSGISVEWFRMQQQTSWLLRGFWKRHTEVFCYLKRGDENIYGMGKQNGNVKNRSMEWQNLPEAFEMPQICSTFILIGAKCIYW